MFLPVEIERIADDIRREVEARGAELIEIQFRRSSGRGCLTILADKAGGISLDDCAEINRAVGSFLDGLSLSVDGAPPALRGAYYLEVNSPGIDRPMKTEMDFSRALGGPLWLAWRDAQGKTYDLRGYLKAIEGGVLKIERLPAGRQARPGQGEWIDIPLDSVVKAVRQTKI